MTLEEVKARADNGDASAMMALAKLYLQQSDNEDFYELGSMYLERAAEAGNFDAIITMAESSRSMAKFTLEQLDQDKYVEPAIPYLEDAHKWGKRVFHLMERVSTDKKSESMSFLFDAYIDSIYWLSAVYCFDDNYAGILQITKDVASPVAQAIHGLALMNLGKTNAERNQAFLLLKNAMNPAFLSEKYSKAKILELLRIETIVSLSAIYRTQNNCDSAYNALSVLLKNTKNHEYRNFVQEMMSHYRKTIFGGYKYIG